MSEGLTVQNTDHNKQVAQRLVDELKKAKRPVILAGNVITFRAKAEFESFDYQFDFESTGLNNVTPDVKYEDSIHVCL